MKLTNEEILKLVKALGLEAASWAGSVTGASGDADKLRERLEEAKADIDRALAWLDHLDE